jgi:hypothetical protein
LPFVGRHVNWSANLFVWEQAGDDAPGLAEDFVHDGQRCNLGEGGAQNRRRFLVRVDSLAHVIRRRGGTGTTRISGSATGVALAGQARPEMESVADLDGCGGTVGDALPVVTDPSGQATSTPGCSRTIG